MAGMAHGTVSVLVIEDDPDICTALEHSLGAEGFDIRVAGSGRGGLDEAARAAPDVVLLDLMLPDMSGLDVLKTLKRADDGPAPAVLVLTAKSEEIDRIIGFELGADDYVTKPFSVRELGLRIRSLLRRRAAPAADGQSTRLVIGPIEVDTDRHQASVEGKQLKLTLTEFRLLQELVEARGRVRTRESLLSEIWGYDSQAMSRTVDTHIRRLRNKLGLASSWLDTVRGVGYRIHHPDSFAGAHGYPDER